jgi:very-short-patch-repair endonuclease
MPRTTKPGTTLSRRLRRDMTDAERRLWWHLKRVPVENTHFRRQVPIGPFVVDFALLSHRLVIEVDGDHHGREPYAEKDLTRTAWLNERGFRVLRFSNADVMRAIDSVLDTIHAALYEPSPMSGAAFFDAGAGTPSPSPSPQGGGE